MRFRIRTWGVILLLWAVGHGPQALAKGEGHFTKHPEVQTFIAEMVQRHGMDRSELERLFAATRLRESILRAISRPAEAKPWYDYRKIFLTKSRIDGGVRFWDEHADILAQAEQAFGVDAQVIVAIIGVETRYGANTGSFPVIDALATLGFEYPKRAKFFRSELEQFLLLTQEERVDRLKATGSYAGAMGLGQFISSSYRRYAVDFDQDGRRDLWHSKMDIIGSVANYLHEHGWQLNAPVVARAQNDGKVDSAFTEAGLKPSLRLADLRTGGIQIKGPHKDNDKAALVELEQKRGPEYWVGFNNFYVITRYNRSQLYAMAVYQLSEEIRLAREMEEEL